MRAASSLLVLTAALAAQTGDLVLVEAESFTATGGWVVDQQFMDLMGSPFLLAHGLGVPVTDAVTTVAFPRAGRYRVWVRTRDWVAPWQAPGAPGRFELRIDDVELPTTFGIEGAEWHWQPGGTVEVGQYVRVALVTSDELLAGIEGVLDDVNTEADRDFEPVAAFGISCAGRKWFLGPRFSEEIEAVRTRHQDLPIIGFPSLGEVSPRRRPDGSYSTNFFHNVSFVLALLGSTRPARAE